jgi:hypothetical protein
MHPLTPYPARVYVDGPELADKPSLVAWLATHDGDARQLKLPVDMDNQPMEREASPHGGRRPSTGGFQGREDNLGIGVTSFEVGGIPIQVSDSALGVSLADHVRTKCKGRASCRLWLEGYWSANTLHLRRVGELVGDEAACVAVEAEHREGG